MSLKPENVYFRYCPLCGSNLIDKMADGMTRRACDHCDFIQWTNPMPVVAAIAEQGDHILLARKPDGAANQWVLIAGFPEAGETLEEAIIREVYEEIGLESEVLELIGVYSLPWKNQVFIVYRLKTKPGQILINDELEDVSKFIPAEIPRIVNELNPQSGAARALLDYANRLSNVE